MLPLERLAEEDTFQLILEGVTVVSTNELFKAIFLYFVVIFMFDLHYGETVARTSTFLQNFFFGLKDNRVTKQMRSFYAQILRAC